MLNDKDVLCCDGNILDLLGIKRTIEWDFGKEKSNAGDIDSVIES